MSDYLKSFAKLEDHQQNNFDDGGGGYDFTTRRLKMDLDRKFSNLSNLAASKGYEIPLHVLNELAESAYKKTELLASRLANVIFKNEISTAIDSKKVVTLKDALELGESYAHGLPAYWVNEKIKSFKKKKWEVRDLLESSVGSWEPSFDTELWSMAGNLNLFIQNVQQVDAEGKADIPAQMVQVLEWKPNY